MSEEEHNRGTSPGPPAPRMRPASERAWRLAGVVVLALVALGSAVTPAVRPAGGYLFMIMCLMLLAAALRIARKHR